ncbi:HTTM domain-containing protein [Flavivirga spongiicola]|uniref:HTTM domain-containing protein n=1 Tax=Flavivirga spongiicola TaxID=421621 RepID=A0ABU7XUN5_9FLAO|nr:HTTM domain-containing protein [Flavivirga sp. MEBiC05379]MDO5979217.1 HTTM domain-containing protein [Flavivirga sp. MEBiC05379]
MLNKWLFKNIDNSALIVFRIIFGLLCFLESVGAIFTGWVKKTLVEPEFTFSFIGFEWLQPFPGNAMYFYYVIMGIFALFIMIGYKYRLSALCFAFMWAATYLMQKSSYNNHYYLLMLLSSMMVFLPAHKYASIDVKLNPKIKSFSMPHWCRLIIVFQLFIVYTYASIAKLYPDWLDTSVMEILMKSKEHYMLVGDMLQQKWLHYILAYGGILFDGLIVPLLLFKPTRKYAFMSSIFFHLFNSIVFQIGIFPYLSLAFTLFFFEPEIIQKLFLKKKPIYKSDDVAIPKFKKPLLVLFSIYFLVQIGLPLRHHFIEDDVLWTEEGHRLSWRMMLRSKSGRTNYIIKNKDSGKSFTVNLNDYLTTKQQRSASTKPDVIWQFAQHLKQEFQNKGQEIAVYVDCKISINGKPYKTLINREVDLTNAEWNAFKHNNWILPSKED